MAVIASLSLDYERNNLSSRKHLEVPYFSLSNHNNFMVMLEIQGDTWASHCFFTWVFIPLVCKLSGASQHLPAFSALQN